MSVSHQSTTTGSVVFKTLERCLSGISKSLRTLPLARNSNDHYLQKRSSFLTTLFTVDMSHHHRMSHLINLYLPTTKQPSIRRKPVSLSPMTILENFFWVIKNALSMTKNNYKGLVLTLLSSRYHLINNSRAWVKVSMTNNLSSSTNHSHVKITAILQGWMPQ